MSVKCSELWSITDYFSVWLNQIKISSLDENCIKANKALRAALVAPSRKLYAVVTNLSSYATRYKMIATISSSQIFPPIVFVSKDRSIRKVKRTMDEILMDYVENVLCLSSNALHYCPKWLILDAENIYNPSKIGHGLQCATCKDF